MGDRGAGLASMTSALVLSVGAHVAFALALVALPSMGLLSREAPRIVEIVAIEEVPPPPPPVEPEPEPEPEPEAPPPAPDPEPPPPRPTPQPRRVERTEPRPTSPERPQAEPTPAPPPVEEAIADFTGETLTNDSASFAMPVGNGAPMDGPIGQPGAITTGRRREGSSGGAVGGTGTAAPEGPRVVALADLSRQPRPQGELNAILQRNFPPRARQLGIEGRAVLRFRVMPDGSLARFRTRSETPPDQGFAEACRRTVQQARWEPPLAQDGSAVATDVTFECEFAIGL